MSSLPARQPERGTYLFVTLYRNVVNTWFQPWLRCGFFRIHCIPCEAQSDSCSIVGQCRSIWSLIIMNHHESSLIIINHHDYLPLIIINHQVWSRWKHSTAAAISIHGRHGRLATDERWRVKGWCLHASGVVLVQQGFSDTEKWNMDNWAFAAFFSDLLCLSKRF